ncbi:hypothetical protein M4K87_08085 [Staphylococcus equorum]|uniref:hypothetical protein n=1 Tax=Staphylococcus equorum TaxID=246432 RepID=UPI001F54492C|nr:hypothetical protein [Staphylococcus equorum]MDG0825416.1 hypothetical protein [Staphylococcus equorum]
MLHIIDKLSFKVYEARINCKGIIEVYNDSEVKVQQIIKLTWWDDKKYTDEVVASVIGITEYTLRHAREVILKRVAKAVEYV